MLVIEITKEDGTVKVCRMPQYAFEVEAGRFIEYTRTVVAKKPETLQEYEQLMGDAKMEYMAQLDNDEINREWVAYYAQELAYWLGLEPEEAQDIPLTAAAGEFNLFGLRAILQKAFDVQPLDEYIDAFTHNGDKYYTPEAPDGLLPGQPQYFQKVTVGEYATAMELNRALAKMEGGEIDGLLHMVAVLCRKKGEAFPVYANEQTDFIKQRVEELKSIDLETLLRVGFFLVTRKSTCKPFLHIYNQVAEEAAALRQQNMGTIQ